ncbi:MAG: sulfite exporter TauE/SafE family protein [Planctomycetota bacterium]|nr:MAG: sulfite exporter TauE/SafE family protein [Planctomycetota bacterium]REK21834.1 MAG: sulfite exporter TauE/SafE family protein [Planctomycetota bacterium]REK37634.1 MAG: sulfite exporter TauE/SafE family protein [Planctomycetota bacterium]
MPVSPTDLVLAAVAAAVIGLVSGIFGIGGGFLLVPVLNVGLGVPMHIAVGSAACQLLGPATTIALARKVRLADTRLPLLISGGLLIGVFLGADVLRRASAHASSDAGGGAETADVIVLSVYLGILLFLGVFSLYETHRAEAGRPLQPLQIGVWPVPPRVLLPIEFSERVSVTILAWLGLLVGFVSGLIGIGGGLLAVPGMIYLLGVPTQRAVTWSNIIVWIVALQSTIVHAWYGHVLLPLVASLLLGGTVGARIGTGVGQRMRGRQLRRSFGWLTLATAGMTLIRLVVLLK